MIRALRRVFFKGFFWGRVQFRKSILPEGRFLFQKWSGVRLDAILRLSTFSCKYEYWAYIRMSCELMIQGFLRSRLGGGRWKGGGISEFYGMSGLTEFCCLIFQLFRGNFDRFSLVEQPIDPPVNGRYVRFNPRSWHGHVSMRVEVYGCRAGESGKTSGKNRLSYCVVTQSLKAMKKLRKLKRTFVAMC